MTCREVIDFLMSYLNGELSDEVRERFESHLANCSSCVAYLQNYRKTVELSKSAFKEVDSLPSQVPEEMVQAMLVAISRP